MILLPLLASCALFQPPGACLDKYVDDDGDGYGGAAVTDCHGVYVTQAGDCDDADSDVHPGAAETCARAVDADCNGEVQDDPVDVVEQYVDVDGDGYGTTSVVACPADGLAPVGDDCDDAEASVNPSSAEVCNGRDDNCDLLVDADDPALADGAVAHPDWDGDGYGDSTQSYLTCALDDVQDGSDCDDGNAAVNPAATEICNAIDDDCDDAIDDDDGSVEGQPSFFEDEDGDGYGSAVEVRRCEVPAGFVETTGDCDDHDADAHPAAVERCDGSDNDCDGAVDIADDSLSDASSYYLDADADGHGAGPGVLMCEASGAYVSSADDCDDADADAYPGAPERCDDVDDDCDGLVDGQDPDLVDGLTWFTDDDGDGYGDATRSQTACHAPSGTVADDSDCDDSDRAVSPGGVEVCDSGATDEDCDGLSEDLDPSVTGTTQWYADADGDGWGGAFVARACSAPAGAAALVGDCDEADPSTFPGAEDACGDYYDRDCDGADDTCVDADGDGYADGEEDLVVDDGSTVCVSTSQTGFDPAWVVGYGFGGSSDWTDLTHPAYLDGDFWCYDFGDGLYRVNFWAGSGSGAYTSWAFLDPACDGSAGFVDDLCWENLPAQGGGYALCFVVSGGAIEGASSASCEAT